VATVLDAAREAAQKVDLSNRVAIVTGAGSGIGRSMALTFSAAGAKVTVNDIIAERAHETVEMIVASGGTAVAAVADISEEAAVNAFVTETADRWGQIDILCNNAGIMDQMAMPEDTPTDLWHRVIAVNVTGQFFVSRAALPHMLKRKSGSIINTASIAGIRGASAGLAYTVSKHGVVGLTRNIAWAHGPNGIRCNAICPGPTQTNITGGGGLEIMDPAGVERLLPVLSLADRSTGPQTMANIALFLASDAAVYVNGTIIPVDGGWMAG
jgi:NAD(P)-dependent dehydrogenase (short-subunit alcohol dehydrogenase family)